jgi:hypothetical protein
LIENQVKGIAGVKSIINNMQKTMSQI